MSPIDKKFSPSNPIGTTDEPDSEVSVGARIRADITIEGSASCVYAGQIYVVGAKVCMTGQIHQCGSSGQWFNLGWDC
jgi:hypothetical protein